MRYWEDLKAGERASFGRYEVTRDEVIAFAQAYDPQPFHLSDEGAADTYFGRLAASGWHSCAMTMAMFARAMADDGLAALGSPGLDELLWLKPVHPGDVLRCETELLGKRPSASRPGIGLTRTRVTTYNQDDDAVLTFTANGFVRMRPA